MTPIQSAEQQVDEELEHLEEYLLWWWEIQRQGGFTNNGVENVGV